MKHTLLFLSISMLVLASCSKIKEAITVPVTTTLNVDVPISVSAVKSLNLNDKAGTIYTFSSDKVLEVAANVDMSSYINKIKSVDITGATITIQGLTGTSEILTLDLSVSGVSGPVFSKTNITASSNNPFSPDITPTVQAQLNLVEAKLVADRKITITVSGTANAAPLTLTAKLAFNTKFICMPLN